MTKGSDNSCDRRVILTGEAGTGTLSSQRSRAGNNYTIFKLGVPVRSSIPSSFLCHDMDWIG